MVEALGDVYVAGGIASEECDEGVEVAGGGFVGSDLLGCNDAVELDFQESGSALDHVFVNVGEDNEVVVLGEALEGCNGVREWGPGGDGVGQVAFVFWVEGEAVMVGVGLHDCLQDLAVGLEWAMLGFWLKTCVEAEDFFGVWGDAFGSEPREHGCEDALLPVDEGAIAVEGKGGFGSIHGGEDREEWPVAGSQ